MWLISLSQHLDITMSALCTCCFVTFQAMSSMEISQNVGTPQTWPMMKIILVEVRDLLLLNPPHQNHSPNQPPNRSQSQNPKEKQTSICQITSPPHNAFVCDGIGS